DGARVDVCRAGAVERQRAVQGEGSLIVQLGRERARTQRADRRLDRPARGIRQRRAGGHGGGGGGRVGQAAVERRRAGSENRRLVDERRIDRGRAHIEYRRAGDGDRAASTPRRADQRKRRGRRV